MLRKNTCTCLVPPKKAATQKRTKKFQQPTKKLATHLAALNPTAQTAAPDR